MNEQVIQIDNTEALQDPLQHLLQESLEHGRDIAEPKGEKQKLL